MKQLVMLLSLFIFCFSVKAQMQSINIATDKTISLVFPFPIKHVDRGTRDILVQQPKETNNILLVKASQKDFTATNLSIVTEDGSMYSFALFYNDNPDKWIYQIPVQRKASLATYANGILDNIRTVHGVQEHKWDILANIKGIYIKDNTIYYQLSLKNSGPINYDIDVLRFFIRDKKKARRTAIQENEITPLYVAGNATEVKANSSNVIVAAFDKFTIPDLKYLIVQIMEKNGGRHIQLKLNNRNIIKAIELPDLK